MTGHDTRRLLLSAVLIALTWSSFSTSSVSAQSTNVALGKPVTASVASGGAPLSIATDGGVDTNPFVSLAPGHQWLQVDLQGEYQLSQLRFFHYWGDNRTYRDVIAQVSADGVNYVNVFNNDADGSSGFGVGGDAEYADTYAGKTVNIATPICARYVRLHSNGSSMNGYNHYVEVRAYGTAATGPCGTSSGPTNVALGKPVTASAASLQAPLTIVTDGDSDTNPFVSLGTGQQWIEIDLQGTFDLSRIRFFHYWGDNRTYYDVVARVSPDRAVYTTIFNNDLNGSAGFGTGSDPEYAETYAGRTVNLANPVCARYVRLYSNGSSLNGSNHYVEIQAFGTASAAGCGSSSAPTNVALNKPVTASVASGSAPLSIATDGDSTTNPYVSLAVGPQWIEVDLQDHYDLSRLRFFHYWGDGRTYRDVIARVSTDGVSYTTVFNNDANGSAGFGVGADAEYAETYAGKTVSFATPICARYVRLYSNGSSLNGYNHYVELQAVGTPSAGACGSPPPPPPPSPTRDATRWPFATPSPWNMPIGSGAQFEASSAPCSADVSGPGISAWINASQWSHPVYRARTTDPWVDIFDEGVHRATIQVPANATPSLPDDPNWFDGHLHVIDANGRYVHEMWQARRRDDGDFDATYYVRNDLYSTGVGQGGVRAYGGSAIGGLIRSSELTNGIPHALAFAIPQSRQRKGWVWPATSEDGGGNNNYSGHVPMGTLVAIPPNVDLTQMSPPLSAPGMALGRAMQDYGAYHVDSTYTDPNLTVYVETGAASERTQQAIDDLRRLRPLLRCVTNNRPDNIGGGGTRRAPLAPPLGTPPN